MALYKDNDNFRCSHFVPAVVKHPVHRTSDPTPFYNCFAYAAGETHRPWSPLPILPRGVYWPRKVIKEDDLWEVFYGYETIGYELCDNDDLVEGIEKIAIYVVENDVPRHVAIQRKDGSWQSKLGNEIDVRHTLASLEDLDSDNPSDYGKAKYFMSRKRQA